MKSISKKRTPSIVNLTVNRRYLTEREVERLMDCARKYGRYGHRDATMMLVAYRHGLRASEVCDLQWHQNELSEGRLHVHRVKNGIPSVHPIRGDEMRALRKLRRDYPKDAYVFVSERGGPTGSSSASGRPPRCHSPSTRTCFAMPVGSNSRTMATTPGPCSTTSGTRTSSTRSDTPKWRPIGSRTFGDELLQSLVHRKVGLNHQPIPALERWLGLCECQERGARTRRSFRALTFSGGRSPSQIHPRLSGERTQWFVPICS